MTMFDLEKHLKRIKKNTNFENLGMILIHNGVVRATSKNGKKIKQMNLSYDKEKVENLIKKIKALDFVEDIIIWINNGKLDVGDDIMYVILAGDRRKNLLPLFEKIIETIKTEIVMEVEQ